MNDTRVRELIDAYGASAARWPAEERAAAREQVAASTSLQAYLQQAENLDAALNTYVVQPSMSVNAVLSQIPSISASTGKRGQRAPMTACLNQWLSWLFPNQKKQIWQPLAAASLSLFIGIYLGTTDIIAFDDADWSEPERYLFLPLSTQEVHQ